MSLQLFYIVFVMLQLLLLGHVSVSPSQHDSVVFCISENSSSHNHANMNPFHLTDFSCSVSSQSLKICRKTFNFSAHVQAQELFSRDCESHVISLFIDKLQYQYFL